MNLRGGLLRFWIIFSALFISAVFLFSYDSLYKEFKNEYFPWKPKSFILLVPVDCKDARGKKAEFNLQQQNALVEARKRMDESEGAKSSAEPDNSDYSTSKDDSYCWYELPKFRILYPEYKDLDDEALSGKLYDKAGIEIKHYMFWKELFKTLIFAVGIPLLVLALGRSLFWAIAGFRK